MYVCICVHKLFLTTETCWRWNTIPDILVYCNVIRPIMEYVFPVWHYGLTAEQASALQVLHKRAINIIYLNMKYYISLTLSSIKTLSVHVAKRSPNGFSDATSSALLPASLPPP